MASSSPSSPSLLPDPALPAPPLSDVEQGFTAEQLISRQLQLEEAAREAVPFSFLKGGCTYEKGYIKQPVYACKTCGGGGVCAGCSVGCHAAHDLVELFAKRSFRCDCGTLSLARGKEDREASTIPCTLRGKDLKFAPQNDDNAYGKNFEGAFCRCERGKQYNAETEEETMFQCLCCEDWLHESCTSLRPGKNIDDIDSSDRDLADGPLVDHDSFELFICNECVRKPGNETLMSYVGHRGWIVCLPADDHQFLPDSVDDIPAISVKASGKEWSQAWKVYGLVAGTTTSLDAKAPKVSTGRIATLSKRSREELGSDGEDAKRPKLGLQVSDSFSNASQDGDGLVDGPVVQDDDTECVGGMPPLFTAPEAKPCRLDVYLTESFRERLCHCKGCQADISKFPFLIQAEETYSPPRSQSSSQHDIDARSEGGASQTSSTYDLGLAALQRLPRAQMMESLEAYNRMRDALFTHLRPFAEEGRVVDGESLREFFRKQREDQTAPSE